MKRKNPTEGRIAPYSRLCDWVYSNENRFDSPMDVPSANTYGVLDGTIAYITPYVLMRAVTKAGFSYPATMEYLRNNLLIDTGWPDEYGKFKQFNGVRKRYIWLHLAGKPTPQNAQKSKFCPLRTNSDIPSECRCDCAWFVEGEDESNCAILEIAYSLRLIENDTENAAQSLYEICKNMEDANATP